MKAQFEVQFNWILVLVAGALIFLFFFGVVGWVKKGSEQSAASTVATYLDALLTGSSVTRNTVTRFQLPSETVHFTCDDYRVGKSETSTRIRGTILFAPTRIETGRFVAWSEPWDVPFRVANFLFLGSPDIRYVFIGDTSDPLFRELRDAFPPELGAEFNPPLPLTNTNRFKVRVIVINNAFSLSIQPFKALASEDFTALQLTGSELSGAVQTVFFEKSHPSVLSQTLHSTGSTSVFGKAAVLGAIFTDSFADYQCALAKGMARMRNVAAIYEQRAISLASAYASSDPYCQNIFETERLTFVSYATAQTSDDLSGLANDLLLSNLEAQRRSCALLY
ncbi:MAG: hypothetical protein Q7S65_02020 [Nanoarchaeota archaeon]|nr:hypothetical protein [Nanoarchaeota archaeon]